MIRGHCPGEVLREPHNAIIGPIPFPQLNRLNGLVSGGMDLRLLGERAVYSAPDGSPFGGGAVVSSSAPWLPDATIKGRHQCEAVHSQAISLLGGLWLVLTSCFDGKRKTSPRSEQIRGCGAAGSAPAWHAGGQGFESPQLHFGKRPRSIERGLFALPGSSRPIQVAWRIRHR